MGFLQHEEYNFINECVHNCYFELFASYKMFIKNDFWNQKVTSSSNYHWVLVKPNQKLYNGTKCLNEFLLKSFHVLFIRIIIIFIKNSWVERGDLLWKRDFGGQENRESDSQSVKESWRWPKSRCSSWSSILLHRRLKGKFLANFWHDWKANFFSPLLIRIIISISQIHPNFPPTCAKIIEGKRTPPLEKWVIVQIINPYLKVIWNSHRNFHLQKEPFLNFIINCPFTERQMTVWCGSINSDVIFEFRNWPLLSTNPIIFGLCCTRTFFPKRSWFVPVHFLSRNSI